MSSLKDKFDDYREEPQYASWQKVLSRLNAEMPVRRKRKYFFWLIPAFIIGTTASIWLLSDKGAQPVADEQKNQSTTKVYDSTLPATKNVADHNTTVINPQPNNNMTVTHPNAIVKGRNPVIPHSTPTADPVLPTPDPDLARNTGHMGDPDNSITNKGEQTKPADDITTPKTNPTFAETIPTKEAKIDEPGNTLHPDSLSLIRIKEQRERPFLLEIYYAGGVSNIILKDPLVRVMSSATITNNKSLRKDISKVGYSFTTGFGVKMDLPKHNMRIKTGFYFTQVDQTLYYDSKEASCNCGKEIALKVVDNDPDINTVTPDEAISKGNTNSFTNKYSLREIPVLFEYLRPLPKHNNMSTAITFGLSYMYMRGINSLMADADNVGFVSIVNKTAVPSIFPTYKDAFNLIAGYGFIYHAKYNVEWSLAPQLKMAITSLSKDIHWFREYPWQFQVGFGVGHRF